MAIPTPPRSTPCPTDRQVQGRGVVPGPARRPRRRHARFPPHRSQAGATVRRDARSRALARHTVRPSSGSRRSFAIARTKIVTANTKSTATQRVDHFARRVAMLVGDDPDKASGRRAIQRVVRRARAGVSKVDHAVLLEAVEVSATWILEGNDAQEAGQVQE